MSQLAPAICPGCDLVYSERQNDEEIADREIYFHYYTRSYCVVENGISAQITLPGNAPNE